VHVLRGSVVLGRPSNVDLDAGRPGVGLSARPEHRICSGCHGSVADPLGSRGWLGALNGARQYVREVGDAEPSMRGGNTPRRSRAPIS
jgi:hypothetical protein